LDCDLVDRVQARCLKVKIDGLGCCQAKQLCLEAQPNRPARACFMKSQLPLVSIWTCLSFFEQRARALQLIEHTHPSTHGNKHQPHTTMHHSFIAVSHVDMSLTSYQKFCHGGHFCTEFCVWAGLLSWDAPYPPSLFSHLLLL